MIKDLDDRDHRRSNYLLLTGATGFVGRYLMRDLLLAGHRLAVIVRPSKRQSARARVDELLSGWEEHLRRALPRPVVIEGNLAEPECGLEPASKRWIASHCERMLHNAAVLRFHAHNHSDEPWLTNVDGTRRVLQLCRDTGIRQFHAVSTGYVCGDRPGLVYEDELDVGQEFRNDYERSKFVAEKMIRAAKHFDSTTIYRPAVIAGDSTNGYTSSYHGLYLYLRLMAILVPSVEPDRNGVRHTDMLLPMRGDEPRNIVPVNWVSQVISRLVNRPQAHGQTFHLAPDCPITPRQVVEYGYEYFNSTGVIYQGEQAPGRGTGTLFEANFLEAIKQYESYDHTDPRFDRRNLNKHVRNLPCPAIDREVMHRYFSFGELDRWGKRRGAAHDCSSDVYDHLEKMRAAGQMIFASDDLQLVKKSNGVLASRVNGKHDSVESLVLGLDLVGQGGGQWHLVGHPAIGFEVRLGLPPDAAPVLHLPTEEFRKLIDQRQEPERRFYQNVHESADMQPYDRIVSGVMQSIVTAPAC